MYGPVIEGELVRLRPPRADDAEAMNGWFEDLEVTRYLFIRNPPGIDAEKEWLDARARDPDSVNWAVEFEGRLVGGTGIHMIDWKNGWGTTGTVLGDRAVWGRGLGRELMQLRTDYAFTQLSLRKLKSSHIDGNDASHRAQVAAGYRVVGRYRADRWVDGQWRDLILTEVLRKDWERKRRARGRV
ncbi:MAG: GNAT family N-acetyltransferase [Isosphaerales bacterium]